MSNRPRRGFVKVGSVQESEQLSFDEADDSPNPKRKALQPAGRSNEGSRKRSAEQAVSSSSSNSNNSSNYSNNKNNNSSSNSNKVITSSSDNSSSLTSRSAGQPQELSAGDSKRPRNSSDNSKSSSSQNALPKSSSSSNSNENQNSNNTDNISSNENQSAKVVHKYHYPEIQYSIPDDLLSRSRSDSSSMKSVCLDMISSIVENEKAELKPAMASVKHSDEYYSLICQALDSILEASTDAIPDDADILPEFQQDEKKIQESLKINIENLKKYGAELDRLIDSSNVNPTSQVEGRRKSGSSSHGASVDSEFDIWGDGVPSKIIAIMKNENIETSVGAHKAAYLSSLKEMKSSCDRIQGQIQAATETLEKADAVQTSLYNSYKFFASDRVQAKAPTNNTKKLFKEYQKLMK